MTKNPIRLHGGKSIIPSQEEMIEKILTEQTEKAQAKMILLIDTSGQVISFHGKRGAIDLVALGALTASDMAASQEIARISEIYQENQMIIRQGSKMNTIIYEVDRDLILLFMVPASVPLGWFCYLVRDTAEQIKHVVLTTKKESADMKFTETDENMSDLVNNALENVWKE
jgi:predicted regulator of Ras-like GTPase activity (Roadblock/LC7/MglB family)